MVSVISCQANAVRYVGKLTGSEAVAGSPAASAPASPPVVSSSPLEYRDSVEEEADALPMVVGDAVPQASHHRRTSDLPMVVGESWSWS